MTDSSSSDSSSSSSESPRAAGGGDSSPLPASEGRMANEGRMADEGMMSASLSQGEGGDGASADQPYVIGIGASAGGFEPLEKFFGAMPPDTGAAFVVVQHLSPDFKSLMPELLSRHTTMRVIQAEDAMSCEANCLYLIPPKKNMVLREGRLRLHDQDTDGERALQFPIDQFFSSLAEEMKARSVAIVLSGAGSDGTRGVRKVNEVGGLVMVQSPETAQFDGMPRSALSSGSAHSSLPPDEIARAVCTYVKRLGFDSSAGPIVEGTQDPVVIQHVVSLLRSDSTIDFSHYRIGTISRRISRRISITGVIDLAEYIDRLSRDAEERMALRNDLLIGVTGFFRDTEAWEVIVEKVLKPLVVADDARPIRCWVTACSTGEEVYSLAMTLLEVMAEAGVQREVKIFATDIDKRALESAAAGEYAFSVKDEVSPERLQRFFVSESGSFRVARALREMVIFAEHNLNRDAPFTNMDIVTCRNALIYMEPGLQSRVLSTLHFSLRVGGSLFLGAAETCGDVSSEFEVVDARWKLFSKRRDVVLRLEGRRPTLSLMQPIVPNRARAHRVRGEVVVGDSVVVQAFRGLLHERNSACFLVSKEDELLHVFGKAELYTRVPEGSGAREFSRVLLPELVLPLGTAQQRLRQSGKPWRFTDVELKGSKAKVDLTALTIEIDDDQGLELVLVEDAAQVPRGVAQSFTVEEHVSARIEALEESLRKSRESLRSTVNDLETANEEHQATNEELMASNEELQSTNEELQSVNEELYTVNAEHQSKIQELIKLNNDVHNLLRNSPMATLFLSDDLSIRKFTTGIQLLANVTVHDIGRPLDHFTHRLVDVDLWAILTKVRETGELFEGNVLNDAGQRLLVRILPYEDEGQQRAGLVVTLLDADSFTRLLERSGPKGTFSGNPEDAARKVVGHDRAEEEPEAGESAAGGGEA